MAIKILADEVASQIAAGEVVERPVSVVKELLENAIDAGSTRISIRIEEAGKKLIEVNDNGSGISAEDLPLAVARHATSKLSSADELFHIRTLGFRGEALASIGSVSRLVLLSRRIDQPIGAQIVVEGGKVLQCESYGGVIGTLVRVQDLFYNTPARLKFLKRDVTEKQQIDALVTRYAVAYPSIAIHLEEDGKNVLRTTGNGNQREVLAQIYGIELAKQLLEVIFDEDEIQIKGFISPISVNRSNRKEITFFVNGRWVQDIALTTALMKAYQTFLMVGRYPLSVLFIQIEPEDVDVNVHPAKAEVRFRQPDSIFAALQRAVRRALMAYSPVPQISTSYWRVPEHPNSPQENALGWHFPAYDPPPKETDLLTSPPTSSTPDLPHADNPERIPILRLIGQIGATYLVAEGPDGLYLIDQHAAHERVLFEKMTGSEKNMPAQVLLEPALVQLPAQSSHLLRENLPLLNEIGFQVEEFGTNTFRVRAIPALFVRNNPVTAVQAVVEDFEEDETPLQGMLKERLIARICKRMAVKGGTVLTSQEQLALLSDLESCQAPRTCPHGRPTMIHLSVDLLERQFGRRGARSS